MSIFNLHSVSRIVSLLVINSCLSLAYCQWDFNKDGLQEILLSSADEEGGVEFKKLDYRGNISPFFSLPSSTLPTTLFLGAFQTPKTIIPLTISAGSDHLYLTLYGKDIFPLTRRLALKYPFDILSPDNLAGAEIDDLVISWSQGNSRVWRVLKDLFGRRNGEPIRVLFGSKFDLPFLWQRRGHRAKLAVVQRLSRSRGPVVIRVKAVESSIERTIRIRRELVEGSSTAPHRVPVYNNGKKTTESLAFIVNSATTSTIRFISERGKLTNERVAPIAFKPIFGHFIDDTAESQLAYYQADLLSADLLSADLLSVGVEAFCRTTPPSSINPAKALKVSFSIPEGHAVAALPTIISAPAGSTG